jgi:hypothetical protein
MALMNGFLSAQVEAKFRGSELARPMITRFAE